MLHCGTRWRLGGASARCGAVSAWLILIVACGKVGEPLPPQPVSPPTIQDLSVEVAAGRTRLSFTLPRQVEWVEIYRQCDPRLSADRVDLIARVNPEELKETTTPERFSWTDPQRAGAVCRYRLRFVDAGGFRSAYSNLAP